MHTLSYVAHTVGRDKKTKNTGRCPHRVVNSVDTISIVGNNGAIDIILGVGIGLQASRLLLSQHGSGELVVIFCRQQTKEEGDTLRVIDKTCLGETSVGAFER